MPKSKIIFEKTYENGWHKKLVRRSKPTGDHINAYLRSPNGETFSSPKSLLRYIKNHPEFWQTFDALEINLEKEVDSATKLSDDTWLLIDFLDEKKSEMADGISRFVDSPITRSEERSGDTTTPMKCRNDHQLDLYSQHQKINRTLSSASPEARNATSATAGRPSPVSTLALGMVSSVVLPRHAPNILSTMSTLSSQTSAGPLSGSGTATKIKTVESLKPSSLSSPNSQNSEEATNQSLMQLVNINKQKQGSIGNSSSTSVKLHKVGGDQSKVGVQQLISQDGDSSKYSNLKRLACEPLDKVAPSDKSENPSHSELLKNPSHSSITVPSLLPTKWLQKSREKLPGIGVMRKFASFYPAKRAVANFNFNTVKAGLNNKENIDLITKKELQHIIKLSTKKQNLLRRKKSKNLLKLLVITNLKWKAKRMYIEEKENMCLIPGLNQIGFREVEKILIKQEKMFSSKEIELKCKNMYVEEKENMFSTADSNRNVIREFEKLFIKQEKLPSSQEIKIWADKYEVPYEFVENYFVEQWNGKMKYELMTARIQNPNQTRKCGANTFDPNPDLSFVINDSYVIEIDNAEKDK